jgi:hypothetical protein
MNKLTWVNTTPTVVGYYWQGWWGPLHWCQRFVKYELGRVYSLTPTCERDCEYVGLRDEEWWYGPVTMCVPQPPDRNTFKKG